MNVRLNAVALCVLLAATSAGSAAEIVWPQTGRVTQNWYTYVNSTFGYHHAVDIAGIDGSPVGAALGGTVTWRGKDIYGALVVKVAHASGYDTVYAHFSSFGHSGTVAQGETIGYEGATGFATGPHVHFCLERWGAKKYMPASVGGTVHKGSAIPYNYPGITTTSSSPASSTSTYTVKSGDTLSGIAASHGVSLTALEAANPQITNPNVIFTGQVIRIP